MSFQIGEEVYFSHKGNRMFGKVIRINQKTISVEGNWGKGRLSPQLVTKVGDTKNQSSVSIKQHYSTTSTFCKNDRVMWNHKGKTYYGIIERVNTKTCTILSEEGTKWRISPSYISLANGEKKNITTPTPYKEQPRPDFEPSGIVSQSDLKSVLIATQAKIYSTISKLFTPLEMEIFKKVKIQWGSQLTFRNGGWNNWKTNTIQISKSFQNTPKEVIISIIWHELLHIHFSKHKGRQSHSPEFREYERKCPKFKESEKFFKNYLQYMRYMIKSGKIDAYNDDYRKI